MCATLLAILATRGFAQVDPDTLSADTLPTDLRLGSPSSTLPGTGIVHSVAIAATDAFAMTIAGDQIYVVELNGGLTHTYDLDLNPLGTIANPGGTSTHCAIAWSVDTSLLYWLDVGNSLLWTTNSDGSNPLAIPLDVPPDAELGDATIVSEGGLASLRAIDIARDRIVEIDLSGIATGLEWPLPEPGLELDANDRLGTFGAGIATIADSCVEITSGRFRDGGVSAIWRMDMDDARPATRVMPTSASGSQFIGGIAWHASGSTGSGALYVVGQDTARIYELVNTGDCPSCPHAVPSELQATVDPLTGDVTLSWMPLAGTLKLRRDGVALAEVDAMLGTFIDTTRPPGDYGYDAAAALDGVTCEGPRCRVWVPDLQVTRVDHVGGEAVGITASPDGETIYVLDLYDGLVQVYDHALNPIAQFASPGAPGAVMTGIAYDDHATGSVADDTLHFLDASTGTLIESDLAGVLISSIDIVMPAVGQLGDIDVVPASCGGPGFIVASVEDDRYYFLDTMGVSTGTSFANPGDEPPGTGAFGVGIASASYAAGFEVPFGTRARGYVDRIWLVDCTGSYVGQETLLGPGTAIPEPFVAGIVVRETSAATTVRIMVGDGFDDIIIQGVEPLPCDDADGIECDYEQDTGTVIITWPTPSPDFTMVEIFRNGGTSPLAVVTSVSSWVDSSPLPGLNSYEVVGHCLLGGPSSSRCEICHIPPNTKHFIFDGEGDDGSIDSGTALAEALVNNDEEPIPCDQIRGMNLTGMRVIWVALGSFPDNRQLTQEEGAILDEALAAGVHVYCEGGDTWAFDRLTAWQAYDGVDDVDVGDGDDSLADLTGIGALAGFTANYQQDQAGSDYNDRLAVGAMDGGRGAIEIIWTSVIMGGTTIDVGIYYDRDDGGKVIDQSWEFGGYDGDQDALMARYLELLPSPPEAVRFVRGDINSDATVNVADPIFLLSHLFSMQAGPTCDETADVNDDGGIDLADAIYSFQYQFLGGAPPAPPFPECGVDPGDPSATFPCVEYAPCR